jgi:HSP20 family protein
MDTESKPNVAVKSDTAPASALRPIADMERFFDKLFGRGWPALANWRDNLGSLLEQTEMRLPNLDVVDRETEILVRAEVPGIDKKDLDISVTDNLLTIKGKTSSEKKEEKGDYHRHEISSSSFARSVTLPGAVDESKAATTLKDGILEITLPKVEASKRRSITIR